MVGDRPGADRHWDIGLSEGEVASMRYGLDFSWGRPSVESILAAGYTFVLRYLSWDTTGKNLTRAEADMYLAAGIDVCSNWEYQAKAPLNGYGQGRDDALEAARQHAACGGPDTAPIYFSVDFDADQSQQDAINEYMRGAASVVGPGRVGAYGGYWPIARLIDAGLITYAWQTYAWSGGMWDNRAQLRQIQNGITVGGADCDRNSAHADDFGQWHPPSAEQPEQETDMVIYVRDNATGKVYVSNFVNRYELASDNLQLDNSGWWTSGRGDDYRVPPSALGPKTDAPPWVTVYNVDDVTVFGALVA